MSSNRLTKLALASLRKEIKEQKEVPDKFKLKRTTRAQKMLLMYHLGILDFILDINITIAKKAKLLSLLIDEDADNIRKDLSKIRLRDSDLKTKTNYEFLRKVFDEVGISEQMPVLDEVLKNIQKKKNK